VDMVEAAIRSLFLQRGLKGHLSGKLQSLAVILRRVCILLPPETSGEGGADVDGAGSGYGHAGGGSGYGYALHHDNLPAPGNVGVRRHCGDADAAEAQAIEALEVCHKLSEQGVCGSRVMVGLCRRGLLDCPPCMLSAADKPVPLRSLN
jgi:hypothetical protein